MIMFMFVTGRRAATTTRVETKASAENHQADRVGEGGKRRDRSSPQAESFSSNKLAAQASAPAIRTAVKEEWGVEASRLSSAAEAVSGNYA